MGTNEGQEDRTDWPTRPDAYVTRSRVNVTGGFVCHHEFVWDMDDSGEAQAILTDYRLDARIYLDGGAKLMARLVWRNGSIELEEFSSEDEGKALDSKAFRADVSTAEQACDICTDTLIKDNSFLLTQKERYMGGRSDGDNDGHGKDGGANN